MPKISIIVPIYNAEKYLCECLDSILRQSYVDFEVVCVNDGSTDSTRKLLNEYNIKDKRIRVFHKENGGVSSARNVGLRKALGEYITFVDIDDTIEKNYLFNLLPKCDEDFVMDSSCTRSICYVDGLYNGRKMIEVALSGWQILCPWGKFFRSNIIKDHKMQFDEKLSNGEDTIFNLTYLTYASKLRTTSTSEYKYNTYTEGSISKRKEKLGNAMYKACSVYEIGRILSNKYNDTTIDISISKYAGITWTLWYSLLPYTISRRATYIKKMFQIPEMYALMKNYLKCNESGRKYAIFYFLCRLSLYKIAAIIIP